MALLGGELGYRILRAMWPPQRMGLPRPDSYADRSKLRALLDDELLSEMRGRTVVDFGCGEGNEAIELVSLGATRVIALDIQEHFLEVGRLRAEKAGCSDRVEFTTSWRGTADFIISLDAFEHFEDPAGILDIMAGLLKPEGRVLASFGPTWYHPLGGHLFSVFPWAHLVFSEGALLRWRRDFKTDGATRFSQVAGGLNQMTIARFERIVAQSALEVERLEPVPIRKLSRIHHRLTREWTTAVVRAVLRKPAP